MYFALRFSGRISSLRSEDYRNLNLLILQDMSDVRETEGKRERTSKSGNVQAHAQAQAATRVLNFNRMKSAIFYNQV